ncbi:hypothetical protein Plim_3259 [Planctopirus limnophila DSM 3776]|uniref:Uncharacterized protein n=1 Tax=Planctopirus limnophila (strain ATCC 43296 / DSM 3776 / IFAM 1008 / Mu 290) TaxID=521674 RepID=D5STP3_PLAL2|nr:hypothetical protein Plim_3259 [Planctopirus limnophila DSM 3776]
MSHEVLWPPSEYGFQFSTAFFGMGCLGPNVFAKLQFVPKIAGGSKTQPQPPAAAPFFIGIRINCSRSHH